MMQPDHLTAVSLHEEDAAAHYLIGWLLATITDEQLARVRADLAIEPLGYRAHAVAKLDGEIARRARLAEQILARKAGA